MVGVLDLSLPVPKCPVNTVAKLAYGGAMGAGSAVVAAPHVAAAWATVIRWL